MILVTGAGGQLGTAFRRSLGEHGYFVDRSQLDLSVPGASSEVIRTLRPSVVINCAAYTAVDEAEASEPLATLINGAAVGEMAEACASIGARFVTYSTDYVFDGTKTGPYLESDPTAPINAYGRSKLAGETLARQANDDSLIVRTSWVMSGTHRSFAAVMLDLIAKGDVSVIDDQRGHPTLVNDLVAATLDGIDVGASGVVHLTNKGAITWYELARTVASFGGLDPERVKPCSSAEYETAAARPLNSVLDSERLDELGIPPLPDFRPALEEAVAELQSA
jgi:dTDP-4-dehydrorhamnose reductase